MYGGVIKMTQQNNYHPCTSILIEALRNMEGGDKVLKEWDKQRQIVDKKWQAAKADIEHQTGEMIRAISLAADAREAALEREIAELKASNELLHDALESNQISEKELLSYRAHINVLREALKMSSKSLEAIDFDWECEHGFHQDKCPNPVCEVKAYWDAIAISKKALASTPAQPLQAHDDEVIEQVA